MSKNKSNDSDYVSSTITVEVPEFKEKYVENKAVTFYTLDITNHYSNTNWQLFKRYKEFESLHKELSSILSDIPQIPKKTFLKVSSYTELTKRRLSLQTFLRECISRKDILSSLPFKNFLGISEHSPELTANAPVVKGELKDLPLGVRDFIYCKEQGVIFMCLSEMNIVNRADSLLGNIKFPWDKDNSHIAVGAALVYRTSVIGEAYQFVSYIYYQ